MSRKNILIFVCTLSIIAVLTGCGKKETVVAAGGGTTTVNDQSQDVVVAAVDQAEDAGSNTVQSDTELNVGDPISKSAEVIFSPKDLIPVIVNGKTIAYARINQLERVGIYDWYNNVAVKKNIRHSYSLNLSITNSTDMNLTIGVTPTLVDKQNSNVSSKCNVGWTGFGEEAEFYGKGEIPIEVGFQPEITDENGIKLQLVFNTSEGNSDPVIISDKIFKHVVKGPSLLESGDETQITSVNGAKYIFTLGKVYIEPNLVDLTERTAVEFDNSIKYLKKPQKKRQVAIFDSKKKYAMYASLLIGMQTQHSEELNYDGNYTALRKDYYGEYTDDYASITDKVLKVGRGVRYHLNRFVTSDLANEKFVRFWVEFPDEADVSTLEEKLKFNGRFVVYQCETHTREIKYEG